VSRWALDCVALGPPGLCVALGPPGLCVAWTVCRAGPAWTVCHAEPRNLPSTHRHSRQATIVMVKRYVVLLGGVEDVHPARFGVADMPTPVTKRSAENPRRHRRDDPSRASRRDSPWSARDGLLLCRHVLFPPTQEGNETPPNRISDELRPERSQAAGRASHLGVGVGGTLGLVEDVGSEGGSDDRADTGPGALVVPETAPDKVDYEGELAVVIGRTGRDIPEKSAWDFVAGATVADDISARDIQSGENPGLPMASPALAKGFDGFKPLGPALLTTDELRQYDALGITTEVNGVVRQRSSTAELVFSVPQLLACVSSFLTLEAGDVILTGTPGGTGVAEGRFLRAGDVVTVTVGNIGTLTNTIAGGTGKPREAAE
jgi:hypothetical protein